jgi:hypothetical protein
VIVEAPAARACPHPKAVEPVVQVVAVCPEAVVVEADHVVVAEVAVAVAVADVAGNSL